MAVALTWCASLPGNMCSSSTRNQLAGNQMRPTSFNAFSKAAMLRSAKGPRAAPSAMAISSWNWAVSLAGTVKTVAHSASPDQSGA